MQQLLFINNTLAQRVSGTITPIFRSARQYITAYGFQHLMCWLVSWGPGSRPCARVHTAHQVLKTICSNIRSSAPEDGHNDTRNILS